MLVAVLEGGKRVEAAEAARTDKYLCPACRSQLILKRGLVKVAHFAHKQATDCWLMAEGESQRHLQMKLQMRALLPKAELEVICNPGHRADLLYDKFVIECQASSISLEEWRQRTRDYNAMGYAVLWIWDLARLVGKFGQSKTSKELAGEDYGEVPKYRIPVEMRECHRCSFGRIYVLNPEGKLAAVHFEGVHYIHDGYDESGEYHVNEGWYRTMRHLSFHSAGRFLESVHNPKENITLGNLGEKPWWKRS